MSRVSTGSDSLTGPFLLISLGILFALHEFTRFRFQDTWPFLLILFGLLQLVARLGRAKG